MINIRSILNGYVERSEIRLQCRSFHWGDDLIRMMYGGIAKRASKADESIEQVAASIVPVKRIILIISVVFLVSMFVRVPSRNGVSALDTTLWVGILSFQGAFGVGFIALAPWIIKLVREMIPVMFVGAIRANIVSSEPGIDIGNVQAELEIAVSREKVAFQVMGARLTVQGALFLFGIFIVMPLAIWIPANWEVGILAGTFVWALSLVSPLLFPLFLAYNEQIWKMHSKLKIMHETNISACNRCNHNSKDINPNPTVHTD